MQPVQYSVENLWNLINNSNTEKEAIIKKTNEQTSLIFLFGFNSSEAFKEFPKEIGSIILDFKRSSELRDKEMRLLNDTLESAGAQLRSLCNIRV